MNKKAEIKFLDDNIKKQTQLKEESEKNLEEDNLKKNIEVLNNKSIQNLINNDILIKVANTINTQNCLINTSLDNSKSLQYLNISNHNIGDANLRSILCFLEKYELRTLDVSSNEITDKGLIYLNNYPQKLSKLNLSNNKIIKQGLILLKNRFDSLGSHYFNCFSHLQTLNLCGNEITDEGLYNLLSCKELFLMLENLYLENCDLSDVFLSYLCEDGGNDVGLYNKAIKMFLNNLRILDLSSNSLTTSGLNIFLSSDDFVNLKYLYLRSNKITSEILSIEFSAMQNLIEIDFSHNEGLNAILSLK